MAQNDLVGAGAWVILEPVTDYTGQKIKGMRIDRVVQTHPKSLPHGQRAFFLQVSVPASVFRPLPGVTVMVPESEVVRPEVSIG